jgi:hypothetical protein
MPEQLYVSYYLSISFDTCGLIANPGSLLVGLSQLSFPFIQPFGSSQLC